MDEQNETSHETSRKNDLSDKFVCAQEIHAEIVTLSPGLAGRIDASQDVTINQGGGLVISAGQDAEVSYGGAVAIAVGRDLKQVNGGGLVYAVGRDMQMTDAASGMVTVGGRLELKDSLNLVSITNDSKLEQSLVGILFANSVDLGESNRILLSTPQAAALGAGFGLVFALLSWLLRKK